MTMMKKMMVVVVVNFCPAFFSAESEHIYLVIRQSTTATCSNHPLPIFRAKEVNLPSHTITSATLSRLSYGQLRKLWEFPEDELCNCGICLEQNRFSIQPVWNILIRHPATQAKLFCFVLFVCFLKPSLTSKHFRSPRKFRVCIAGGPKTSAYIHTYIHTYIH